MNTISNTDDVIDSRDVIARIEVLEEMHTGEGAPGLDESEHAELLALRALAAEGEGCADWAHGETLIRDSYFQDYAQELADDCGMIPDNLQWPMTCIDWDQAARELRMDYTSVDFDGVTYWVRS